MRNDGKNGDDASLGIERDARAEETARLLLRLARERPSALEALRALLSALLTPPETDALRSDSPACGAVDSAEPLEKALERAIEEPLEDAGEDAGEDPRSSDSDGARIAEPTTAARSAAPAAPATQTQPRRAHQHTERDLLSLGSLMSRFGTPSASMGLGRPTALAVEAPRGRWDDDGDAAKRLTRLLRAQSRRLRAVRLALHAGTPTPPIDHVLASESVEDWTAIPGSLRGISPRGLREGERWYGLAARAAAEVRDWLSEHPDAELGEHRTPEALRERLQCLANAQKGVYCWLEETCGVRARCGVQDETMATLKRWVAREHFAVFLPSGMKLAQRITSAEREYTERALARFELEHASPEPRAAPGAPPSNGAAGTTAVIVEPKPSHAGRQGRFESVMDAYLAARDEFSDGLILFTERAEDSAEDSAFLRPDEVYEFFRAMHEIAHELRQGQLEGRRLDLVFADRGFRSKPSSAQTRKRYHRFYHMSLAGREVDLSQHVTLGSRNQNTCLSIHWWHDKEGGRFVIGHCGKHLPNTLT